MKPIANVVLSIGDLQTQHHVDGMLPDVMPSILCRLRNARAILVAVAACVGLTAQSPPGTPREGRSDLSTIQVRDCSITTVGPSPIQRTGGITIEFINNAAKPVKEVDFGVLYRAQPVLVKDIGTFSQGVVIKHSFDNVLYGYTYFGPTPEICRVQKVVFEDGTVLQAPSQPAKLPPLPPKTH